MKVLGKVLAASMAVAVIAIGALAAYITYVFDPNAFRADIERQVSDTANIELKINGDIGLSFFPWLAVEIADIEMRFPGQAELAQLEKARAAVNIPALLGGVLEVDRILIDGLALNLISDKNGKGNWQPLTAPAQEEAETVEMVVRKSSDMSSDIASDSETDIEPDIEPDKGSAMALAVAGIEMRDATITYMDETAGQQLTFEGVNITLDQFAFGRLSPVRLDGRLVMPLAEEASLTLPMELSAGVTLDVAQETFNLSDIDLVMGVARMSMSLALADFETPRFTGTVAMPAQAPAAMLDPLQVKLPVLGDNALTTISLKTRFSGTLDVVRFPELEIIIDETKLAGRAAYYMEVPKLELALKGDAINLDNYIPTTNDAEADAKADAATEEKNGAQTGWSKEELLPPLPLTDMDAEVKLELDRATIMAQTVSDIGMAASVKRGVLSVSEFKAAAFGGKLTSTALLDARAAKPLLRVAPKLNGVEAEQLMAMVMDNPVLSANLNLTADIRTSGVSMYDFVHGLNGSAKMASAEGELRGIDMAQQLCRDPKAIAEFGFQPSETGLTTATAGMNADFTIKDGVITNPAFKISVDAAHFTAKGILNLPEEAFDYNLGLTLADDLFGKSCGINPLLKGRRIPVECEGRFDADPAKLCALDTGFIEDIVKEEAAKKIQAEAARAAAKLEKKAQEKLQDAFKSGLEEAFRDQNPEDMLRGLFGR